MSTFLNQLLTQRPSATLKPVAQPQFKSAQNLNLPANIPLNAPKPQTGLSLAGATAPSSLGNVVKKPVNIPGPNIPAKPKAPSVVDKAITAGVGMVGQQIGDVASATKETAQAWAKVPGQTLQSVQGKKITPNPELSPSAKRGLDIIPYIMGGKLLNPEMGAVSGNAGFITRQAAGDTAKVVEDSIKAGKTQPGGLQAGFVKVGDKAVTPAIDTTKAADTKLLGAGDPEARLQAALKVNKDLRVQQEASYTAQRGTRITKAVQAGQQAGGGEAGLAAKKAALSGTFDVVKNDNAALRGQISQSDLDGLINKIDASPALNDFGKISASQSLVDLLDKGKIPTESSLANLSQVFKPETIKALLDTRSQGQKLMALGVDLLNTPRTLMSSADVSAPFRQGIFSAAAHPKIFAKNIKTMFTYLTSPQAFDNFYKQLPSRPTYQKMLDAGLEVTRPGMHSTAEEYFMSNLAERIPGIGKIVRASDRAYTGFLNNYRADLFDVIYKAGEKAGKGDNAKFLQDLGGFVNTATGRGDLSKIPIIGKQLQEAAPLLNSLFFAPRLIASRMNLLNPVYYAKLEPTVRKEAIKQAVSFTAAALSVMGTAKLAGGDVTTDITSSDFGKIKFGNTRYDILGGFQQYAVYIGRMLLNQSTSSTSGKVTKFGVGYKPTNRMEITSRFLRGKLGPVTSFGVDALTGSNVSGTKFDLTSTDPTVNPIFTRLTPMQTQDIFDTINEYGYLGPVLTIPGLFGVGSQTYGPAPSSSTRPATKASKKSSSIGTKIYH